MSGHFKTSQVPFNISFDQGTLQLPDRGREEIESVFGADTWQWDSRVARWRCEAIHYRDVITKICEQKLRFLDQARDWQDIEWEKQIIHPPRPEQTAAIEAWLENKRGVVVMPTGTGKTEVALHLLARTNCSTLVVSPVRDLMYQWHRRILTAFGYDAGIIGDNTFNVRPISVTTYDSAAIHAAKLGNQFKLIVFDECHHLPGNFRRDAATMSIAPYRLGLTATPHRSDGKHADLSFLIGTAVYELGIESVKGKTLADFDVVKIPVHLSEHEQLQYNECSEHVRTFMYERRKTEPGFRWEDLCSESACDPLARATLVAYRRKQAIEDRAREKLRVLEDLFRLHAGTPIIVFAGSNAMARDVSVRFLIPCLLNHCGKKERLEILNGGSASTRQAKQRLGRILRKSGNSRATLYEVVCQDTGEAKRSRQRRKSDAYAGTRHRRI